MKTRFFMCFGIALLGAIFAGCASGKTEVMNKATMPPWYGEEPPKGWLWGIGTAGNSDMQMRIKMAEAAAKSDLNRQLQTLASDMIVDYGQEAGTVSESSALRFQQAVSRQLSRSNLANVKRDTYWLSPDGKTYWVRMKISKTDAARTTVDAVNHTIDSEAARYAEFKAMDALKMMDEMFKGQ